MRFGAVSGRTPAALNQTVQEEGRTVVWTCDAMPGANQDQIIERL